MGYYAMTLCVPKVVVLLSKMSLKRCVVVKRRKEGWHVEFFVEVEQKRPDNKLIDTSSAQRKGLIRLSRIMSRLTFMN